MTLQDVITSLLNRLGHGRQSDTLSQEEIQHWPAPALNLLLEEKLITPTALAQAITCPGCPENCFKPVKSFTVKLGDPPRYFIVCDETDYMGKIALPIEQLQQWQINDKLLATWLMKKLQLRTIAHPPKVIGESVIGSILNDHFHCHIGLSRVEALSLKVNQLKIPLIDVLFVEDDQLMIDTAAIKSLAKQSLSVTPKEYKSSVIEREAGKLKTKAMYANWQKAYRQLLKARPGNSDVWYSLQLAKKPIALGRSANTIRRHMKG